MKEQGLRRRAEGKTNSAGATGSLFSAFRLPPSAFRLLLAVNLAALGLLALWFRFRSLGNIPGLNGDEAWYGVTAWGIVHHGQVTIRTPTGNTLNPLLFGPLLLLHACFKPSIVLLRGVAAASGLLALGLNWWLCRRLFDRPTAIISTLVLALLPIDIAYSRFAWDASQSLLVTLPVWYFSLAAVRFPARQGRYTAAAIVALLAAVVVHPTNVFTAVVLAASLAARWRQFRIDPRRLTVLALAALSLTLWGVYLVRMHSNVGGEGPIGHLVQLLHPGGGPSFAVLYANLFSGETAYVYISGAHSWLHWGAGSLLVWGVLLAAAWRLWQQGNAADRVLVAGWLLQLAAFLLLAGPEAMAPGQERYAICLIAPAVILAARGAALWWSDAGRLRTPAIALALAAAWFVAADFHRHYFGFIEQTGGQAHLAFRTAAVEPKQAALDYILKHRAAGVTWIVADGWWSYWPLRYLSAAEPGVRVVEEKHADDVDVRPALTLARAEGRAWCVRFCDGQKPGGEQILDYGGRPVLSVSHW